MSGWRRCDRCRKVRTTEEFDGEATTCTVCLTAPVPSAPRKRTTTVTRTRTAPRPPAIPATPAEPAVRRPLLGSVGSGDLEVRERRARRAAADALAESHPEEFAALLRDARAAEGLRPLGNDATAGAAPADGGTAPDGD
jgi:hypothetical protein